MLWPPRASFLYLQKTSTKKNILHLKKKTKKNFKMPTFQLQYECVKSFSTDNAGGPGNRQPPRRNSKFTFTPLTFFEGGGALSPSPQYLTLS